jgi:hypothetical protein
MDYFIAHSVIAGGWILSTPFQFENDTRIQVIMVLWNNGKKHAIFFLLGEKLFGSF